MDFNGVYHRANDNYCYPLDEEQLIINIRTGYDVKYVNLIYGDPFSTGILGGGESWEGEALNIPFKKRLKNQLWWTTTIKPAYKRLKYYFELQTENERWFYFEDGFVSEGQMALEGRSRQYFIFPWMNPADIPVTPAWVNDTIWYQIFPERFCNGDPSINPEGTLPWRVKGSVTNEEFFGGDLQGIINKLDYISDLGVSGLYLTPINESPSSHKYDTTDYKKIDAHFGSEETMKTLVREAHNRGIRVMLDGVFNHSGGNFAPWLDVKEKGPQSAYWDWFMVNEWPFGTEGNCAQEKVSHTFCKELRSRLKAIKPDLYILGEIWHDAMPWLRGDEFDSVMNYPLGESIKDFWIDKSLTNEDFEYTINRCYTRYMQQTNDVLFNLLDSHDTKRLRSDVKNLDEYFQQLAALFTMPGSPCIYYGTEIAMEGSYDPDCRRCMPWEEIEQGVYSERTEIIKSLLHLRRSEPLLRSRDFHFPNKINRPRVIEFNKMGWVDNYVEVIINCEEEDIEIPREGEILFSRHYIDNTLLRNGILIRKQGS